jgi:hypothetical protein
MKGYLFQARGKLKPFWNRLWPVRELFRKLRLNTGGLLQKLPVSSEAIGPPKGFCPSTKQWIESRQLQVGETGLRFFEIHPDSIIDRQPPKSISGELHWKFAKDLVHTSPETFVAVIPAGRYWGYYGGNVITPDDILLEDVSKGIRPGAEHEIFLQIKLPRMDSYDGTVAVLSAPECERNYFHWMFDVLPKIQLLVEGGIALDEIDLFATNMSGLAFQLDTLAYLGVPADKLLRATRRLHLKARRLVVPSATINSSFDTPSWICDFLRDLLTGAAGKLMQARTSSPELIYISRRNSAYRRVVNESELVDLLERWGFCTIVPEQMSVLEQAAVFARAKVIVAVHGAGLTNLVCCKPSTKVIELFSPNFVQTNYWGISSAMDLEYFYLFGEGNHPPAPEDPLNRYDDLRIDPNQLKDTLRFAELKVD